MTQFLRDCFGRLYQVGPEPEALMGRPRVWMAWLPWAAMAATGVAQYAFGSLVPRLTERGWSTTDTLWLLAVWTVFQAGAGFPTAYLRERGKHGTNEGLGNDGGLASNEGGLRGSDGGLGGNVGGLGGNVGGNVGGLGGNSNDDGLGGNVGIGMGSRRGGNHGPGGNRAPGGNHVPSGNHVPGEHGTPDDHDLPGDDNAKPTPRRASPPGGPPISTLSQGTDNSGRGPRAFLPGAGAPGREARASGREARTSGREARASGPGPRAFLRSGRAFRRSEGAFGRGPRVVMVLGAVLQVVGLLSLAHFTSLPAAFLGYSVLGGTGAGLVYATCTSTVAKWYPERMAARVSLVTGAFAYGAVPFAVAFLLTPAPVALDVTAAVVGIVVAGAGVFFRDPPPNWWPPHIDPREWARERRPRPVRQFSFGEALRTGVLPLMYLVLLAASAVSLFTVTFFATLGSSIGVSLAVVAVGMAILLAANGVGRSLAIRVSERLGRGRAIGVVLAAQAVGQVGMAGAASAHASALLLVAAIPAGAGGGAFYPLFASLAREYFGERDIALTHAVVYSAKAFGGVVGVGLAAFAVPSWGFPGVLLVSGTVALGSAILTSRLRRPGHVATLPIMYVVDTHSTSFGSGGAP